MSGANQLLDEQAVGRRVAERLDTVADGLGPVGLPDWNGVRSGLRRSVRRRRLKRTGMVAGALASVVALGGTVQLGVLPYPSWAPAVTVAGSAPSALAKQPTKGSLAGDEKWLRAFREAVAAERWDESGGESWSVVNPDDVQVLFAGDVAGHRLAAIEAPYRWGLIETREQVWFMGPPGARPDHMVRNHNQDVSTIMATQFGPWLGYDGSRGQSGWLVLTDGSPKVELIGSPRYASDGTASRSAIPMTPAAPGVYVWATPDDHGLVSVRAADEEFLYSASAPDGLSAPAPLRGARLADEAVSATLERLYLDAGLAKSEANPIVLWAGGPQTRQALALGLQVESGALVIGTYHEDPQVEDSEHWLAQDAEFVLAAQEPDQVALAWQQHAVTWSTPAPDSGQGREGSWHAADTIGVLGPRNATTVEVLAGDGSIITTAELSEGGAVVNAPGATQVRFRDAKEAVVGQTDVIPWDEKSSDKPLWDR